MTSITINDKPYIEIDFSGFQNFYPLFNSGDKALFFKEVDEHYILLAFIDSAPIVCKVSKSKIIEEANLPDNSDESVANALREWEGMFLSSQAPAKPPIPFISYGDL